ncbi:hypothetical protein EON77_13680, partial [bacterium]
MLRTFARHAFMVFLVALVVSCAGGGAGGCGGCGMTPIPGGFPKAELIENAAVVRVTRPGLDFVGGNVGELAGKILNTEGGLIEFEIPKTELKQKVVLVDVTIKICPNGPNKTSDPKECVVELEIGRAKFR